VAHTRDTWPTSGWKSCVHQRGKPVYSCCLFAAYFVRITNRVSSGRAVRSFICVVDN
jgi:hypothetical protein